LDLVVRDDEGDVLDPLQCSTVKLFRLVCYSCMLTACCVNNGAVILFLTFRNWVFVFVANQCIVLFDILQHFVYFFVVNDIMNNNNKKKE